MSNALWTGFFFSEIPDATGELHATHKYFGEQPKTAEIEIRKLIDLAFRWCDPCSPGYWTFDELALFDEESIVLCASIMDDPLEFLREEFSQFRKDDYPYNLHVTVANARRRPKAALKVPLCLKPVEYRLMHGNKKLYTWKLREV